MNLEGACSSSEFLLCKSRKVSSAKLAKITFFIKLAACFYSAELLEDYVVKMHANN